MSSRIYTGIDLVEIDRIRMSVERDARFLMRFFGEEERKLFTAANATERIAANFAAKEAFAKALGTGIIGFELKEVQALRDEKGAPYFYFCGKAAKIVQERNLIFSLSLSHTKHYATAMVVAQEV